MPMAEPSSGGWLLRAVCILTLSSASSVQQALLVHWCNDSPFGTLCSLFSLFALPVSCFQPCAASAVVRQVAHPILFHLEEGAMAQVYPLPWELFRKYEKFGSLGSPCNVWASCRVARHHFDSFCRLCHLRVNNKSCSRSFIKFLDSFV